MRSVKFQRAPAPTTGCVDESSSLTLPSGGAGRGLGLHEGEAGLGTNGRGVRQRQRGRAGERDTSQLAFDAHRAKARHAHAAGRLAQVEGGGLDADVLRELHAAESV